MQKGREKMEMLMAQQQENPEKKQPTARPWAWQDFGRGPIVTSCASGRPIVMDFVRAGMQNAEPRFGKRTDSMGGIMVPLSQWDEMPPDAEFILRAVNNHDALIEAVKLALAIENSVTLAQEKELRSKAKAIYEAALSAAQE